MKKKKILPFTFRPLFWPTRPHSRIGGHYFRTWCPSVHPSVRPSQKQKRVTRLTSRPGKQNNGCHAWKCWGLVGHSEVFYSFIHLYFNPFYCSLQCIFWKSILLSQRLCPQSSATYYWPTRPRPNSWSHGVRTYICHKNKNLQG